MSQQLHVILWKETDGKPNPWLAQCLEYDICAQGSSISHVLERFREMLAGFAFIADRAGKPLFNGLPEAPKRYWDRWNDDAVLRRVIDTARTETSLCIAT